MPRTERLSQFYADDKDIRDLLSDKSQVITPGRLLEIARGRGVFLSDARDDTFSREEVIDYVSRLPFSWPELSRLMEIAHPRARTPRTTSERVHTNAEMDVIERAAKRIEKRHNEEEQDTLSVVRSESRVTVNISYSQVLPGKTRLLQRGSRTRARSPPLAAERFLAAWAAPPAVRGWLAPVIRCRDRRALSSVFSPVIPSNHPRSCRVSPPDHRPECTGARGTTCAPGPAWRGILARRPRGGGDG